MSLMGGTQFLQSKLSNPSLLSSSSSIHNRTTTMTTTTFFSSTISTPSSAAKLVFKVRAFADTIPRIESPQQQHHQKTNKQSSLYQILRIKETASPTEIKSAYRALAKQFHPDAASTSSSDGRHFMEIHNAYATLSDPTERARYDLSIGARRRFRDYAAGTSRFGGGGTTTQTTRRWETDQCW